MEGEEKQKQEVLSMQKSGEAFVHEAKEEGSEEKERKSYGRKGKSPFLLFFVLLPFLLSGIFLYGVYRYGKNVIAERNRHNGETVVAEQNEKPGDQKEDKISNSINKLKTKGELKLLFLGNDYLKSENDFFTTVQGALEEKYGGKVEWNIPELPGNATALSGYLKLQEEELAGDVIFLSFSDYDNPYTFPYYYELLLRDCQRKFPQAEILCLIGDRAFAEDRHTKDNAFVVKNLAEYYGMEVMNLAELMAKKQTDPKAFLTEREAYSGFVQRFYPNVFIEAIEKPGMEGQEDVAKSEENTQDSLKTPLNSLLEQEPYCIKISKEEFQEIGDTGLLLPREKMEALGILGKNGILAQSLSLVPGANQGNCLVDGILTASYSMEGSSYLGIYTKEILPKGQILLLFASKEERENFHELYMLSGVPLERGLENGTALPVPEMPAAETVGAEASSEAVAESQATSQAASSENTEATKAEEKPAAKQEEKKTETKKQEESSSEEYIISDQGPGDVR